MLRLSVANKVVYIIYCLLFTYSALSVTYLPPRGATVHALNRKSVKNCGVSCPIVLNVPGLYMGQRLQYALSPAADAPEVLCDVRCVGTESILLCPAVLILLEPVNMFTIASFFMDDTNINKLLALKNKLLRRLQKQTILTPVCQFYRSFNTLPIPLVYNQNILELVDFSSFLAILFT